MQRSGRFSYRLRLSHSITLQLVTKDVVWLILKKSWILQVYGDLL